MIQRELQSHVARLAGSYPVVTITGPRQSGKTTLCRAVFGDRPYVSLEDPDVRAEARADPRGLLARYPQGAVLDEVQRVPDLLSYIQGIVDRDQRPGMFILTGSAQFELLQALTQSLAGRTALVTLLPLSIRELTGTPSAGQPLGEYLYRGGYPRIYDRDLNATEAMQFYVNSYIERDVRSLLNIKDLSLFETFLKLCAGRSGQILNLSNLANDCGINHATAREWLTVLEASWIVHLVRPHLQNFGKRLVKSPKLYFWDVALMAYLLGIEKPEQAMSHPLRGAMFETLIISELVKARFNAVRGSNVYYFADNTKHEVDAILEQADGLVPVEIKSAQTLAEDAFKSLAFYTRLNPASAARATLVYGGNETRAWQQYRVAGFRDAARVNS